MNNFFKFVSLIVLLGGLNSAGTIALGSPQTDATGETKADAATQVATQASATTIRSAEESVELAVDWLLDFCLAERKFAAATPNDNAKAAIVVLQTAYLLETMPDCFRDDPRRKKVLAKGDRMLAGDVWNSNPVFSSWINGFATIYAVEKSVRAGKPLPVLQRLAESWVERQNREGGWSHGGAGRMVDIYPSTVLCASNFALMSLGAVNELEHSYRDSPDYEDVVDEALTMYRKSQSSRGGFPYGARSYQKGIQSGRTAASLIGLAALQQSETKMFRRALHYTLDNIKTVPFGHASPAMHIGCGGLALAMLGGEHWSRYRQLHFRRIIAVQKKDGSFGDFTDNGPDSLIGSLTISAAYRTGLYTICLTADKGEFIKRLHSQLDVPALIASSEELLASEHVTVASKRKTETKSKIESESAFKPSVQFAIKPSQRFLGLAPSSDDVRPVVFDKTINQIQSLTPESLKPTGSLGISSELDQNDVFLIRGGRAIVITMPNGEVQTSRFETKTSQPQNQQPLPDDDKETGSTSGIIATCFDISNGALLWQRGLPGFRSHHFRTDTFDLLSSSGKTLRRFDLKSGELLHESSSIAEVTSGSVFGFDAGASYVGGMGRLARHDASGVKQWTSRIRGQRGLIQPSSISTVVIGENVFVSTANAHVFCYDSAQGNLEWKLETKGLVKLLTNKAGQLFAIGEDGIVGEISQHDSKPRLLWSTDVGGGLEVRSGYESASHDYQCFTLPGKLIVHDQIQDKITILDSQNGQQQFQLDAENAFLSGTRLAVEFESQVSVFEL